MKKVITVVISLMLILSLIPASVFADSRQVTISKINNKTIQQGGFTYVSINSKANTDDPYTLELTLDKGLTLDSGYSGIITTTERVQINYRISAENNIKPGDYKVNVKAVDPNTKDLLQEMNFTITVEKAQDSFSFAGGAAANISYELSGNDAIYAGDTNILTVTLFNRGLGTVRNAEIELKLPEGMTIESGVGTVAAGTFSPGATVTASFPIVCKESIVNGSYEIVVIMKGQFYTTGGEQPSSSKMEESIYVPVKNGKADQKLDVAKPILMVSDYSIGSNAVTAGKTFTLSFTLTNTSNVDLQNIKVTLYPNNNVFIPVGSSSGFYIEKIKAKESSTQTIKLSSNTDITQGSHTIRIESDYEDTNKKTYDAEDTISIRVVHPLRLVVDPVADPGMLTVGERGYASVNYRNMGNTTINNLVVRVDGNFSMDTSNTYYVGNLASGKSDYYNWQFYPEEAGTIEGTVTFTYEDAAGNQMELVEPFSFEVAEPFIPDFPDEPMPADPVSAMPMWQKIAIGVACVAGVIIVVKLIKRHKAKKQEALELDE